MQAVALWAVLFTQGAAEAMPMLAASGIEDERQTRRSRPM